MDRIALALECEKEINEVLGKALDNPVKPVKVSQAPCQENVILGDEVDLGKLLFPTRPKTVDHLLPVVLLFQGTKWHTSELIFPKDAS